MKNVKSRFPYLALGVFLIAGITIASCNKNEDPGLPPIGGYNTSDEVAAANNVIKISFDGSLTESKGNIPGTSTNTAFATGAKGQAFEGSSTQARYAIYDAPSAFATMTSLSIAFWMKAPQTVDNPDPNPVQGKGVQGIFALANPLDFWGGINLFLEGNNTSAGVPNPDTLRVKLLWQNKRAGVNWQGQDPQFYVPAAVDQWVHIAFTYDAASSIVTVYKNGVKGGAKSLAGPYGPFDGSNTLYADDPGAASGNPKAAPLHGALQFPAATKMVIGANQFSTTPSLGSAGAQPWSTTFRGLLDEFRIYNKGLTSSEVESLYQLEKAGR